MKNAAKRIINMAPPNEEYFLTYPIVILTVIACMNIFILAGVNGGYLNDFLIIIYNYTP